MVDLNLDRNLKALPRTLGCLSILILSFLALGLLLPSLVSRPAVHEYVDIPGPQAVKSFGRQHSFGPTDVIKVSHKYSGQRETHSAWSKIEIAPAAAKAWQGKAHLLPTAKIDTELAPGELREWLNSELVPPIPVFNDEVTPPTWWKPPTVKFRATQQIKWFARFESGYGNALYSAYDESSRTL